MTLNYGSSEVPKGEKLLCFAIVVSATLDVRPQRPLTEDAVLDLLHHSHSHLYKGAGVVE